MVLTSCLTLDQPRGCRADWTRKHRVSLYKIKKKDEQELNDTVETYEEQQVTSVERKAQVLC